MAWAGPRPRVCGGFTNWPPRSTSSRTCSRSGFINRRSEDQKKSFDLLISCRRSMDLREFEERIAAGGRLLADEALQLYRQAPTYWLGRMADSVRARKHPEGQVTYIIDRNVNYTNVCVARCNFCAFYREVGHSEGYVLGFDEIFRKIDETIAVGGVELLLQGGHNPDLPLDWYEDL